MIKTYIARHAFVFKTGTFEIARMPFLTLKLEVTRPLNKAEEFELKYLAQGFVAGETIKGIGGPVILGPEKAFKYEVGLHACGNPDMRQYSAIGPRKRVKVETLEEAREAVVSYQRRHEMGGGNCAPDHGKVWLLPESTHGKNKHVGYVCYNGRYETVAERKAWEKEIKEKYAKQQ